MSRALAETLELHVRRLAGYIGERNLLNPDALARAALYIEGCLSAAGYEVRREEYGIGEHPLRNLVVQAGPAMDAVEPARAAAGGAGPAEGPLLIVGAHYDTAPGTPGADDNASAVAVLIETAVAVAAAGESLPLPVRFAAFCTEEPPHFGTGEMGSAVHARGAKERGEKITGMLSLEMVGYYDERPGSQSYPPLLSRFYPETGDFLALVSDLGSRDFIGRLAEGLRAGGVRLETASLPRWVPGVSLSDHLSFWEEGFPAAMLTDTAMYRNPNYHMPGDLPETLDYERMARVVTALTKTLQGWCP